MRDMCVVLVIGILLLQVFSFSLPDLCSSFVKSGQQLGR
jgi:hypothetical protein